MRRRYWLLLAIAAYWLASSVLFAQSASEVHVLGYSYHFDRSDNWCEDNPGLGYTHSNGVSFILFSNSHCNWTGFANYKHDLGDFTGAEWAVRVGAFWAEDEYLFGWKTGPAATLEATFFERYTVSLLIEAISLHYTWRFGDNE